MNSQPPKQRGAIPVSALEDIIAKIAALQPAEQQSITASQAIRKKLRPVIKEALKRKVTANQLVDILKQFGVDIAPATLKAYVQKKRRRKAPITPTSLIQVVMASKVTMAAETLNGPNVHTFDKLGGVLVEEGDVTESEQEQI